MDLLPGAILATGDFYFGRDACIKLVSEQPGFYLELHSRVGQYTIPGFDYPALQWKVTSSLMVGFGRSSALQAVELP